MHIIIAIFTVISALAIWYMRLKAIGGAAKDIKRAAQSVRNAPRKHAFKRRANKTGLKAVEDPMEAGAILMVLVAGVRANAALAPAYNEAIRSDMRTVFELDEVEAEDLITHAVWMVRDVELVSGVVIRMVDVIRRAPGIGAAELVDMYEMLQRVSEADGAPSEEQGHILGLYRNKVGLGV